jgi:hypothetical protein
MSMNKVFMRFMRMIIYETDSNPLAPTEILACNGDYTICLQ